MRCPNREKKFRALFQKPPGLYRAHFDKVPLSG